MKKISWFMLSFVVFCAPAMVWGGCEDTICGVGPKGGDVNTICEKKSLAVGQRCVVSGATQGYCTNNKKRDGSPTISCAAKICDDDHILWLHKRKGEYVPYGRCQSKRNMQNICDKGHCDSTCKCVLNQIDYKWQYGPTNGLTTKAYYDDAMCRCESTQSSPDTSKTCKYKFIARCHEGSKLAGEEIVDPDLHLPKIINITQNELSQKDVKDFYNLTEDEIAACVNGQVLERKDNIDCNKLGQNADASTKLFCKMFNKDTKVLREWLNTSEGSAYIQWYCAGGMEDEIVAGAAASAGAAGSGVVSVNTGDTAEINNAKAVLSAFFAKAESDVSVWKNEEGKFNTARLASDLGAAVVLGTVGGVVSSVVIKKAQVKKGFEALQCYMHGYKVADWGDVFEASLRTR